MVLREGIIAFSYQKLIRQAALRVSAIKGATDVTKNTAYQVSPLTTTEAGSVDFPLTALHDAAISAVARLVRAYANTKNHPFRRLNLSQTATIAHESLIPSTDSASKSIVGVYGAVRNASTGEAMTEQPTQIIETIIGDATLKCTYNYYKIIDQRFYGTASAQIDVVTFDEATERAAIAAGNTPLPDALFDVAWAAMLAILINDDAYLGQAQLFDSYVQNAIAQIQSGATNFMPAPEQIGSQTGGLS